MRKIVLILLLGTTTLFSSMGSFADPPFGHGHGPHGNGPKGPKFNRPDNHGDNRQEERRMREERGVERLKQHRWQAGYVMPQHYRGNGYKVDYKDNQLPKPERNQQWYKINNDYILVNSDDHSIIRILGF